MLTDAFRRTILMYTLQSISDSKGIICLLVHHTPIVSLNTLALQEKWLTLIANMCASIFH